jgi:hypothetical protein
LDLENKQKQTKKNKKNKKTKTPQTLKVQPLEIRERVVCVRAHLSRANSGIELVKLVQVSHVCA